MYQNHGARSEFSATGMRAAAGAQQINTHPLTALHEVLVRFFVGAASMDDVRRAVLDRGHQLEARGAGGAPIIADVKAIARQAARKTHHEIDESTWQSILAPLEVFF